MIRARSIIILFLISVMALTGCPPKHAPAPPWEKDARALLDQAQGLYARRQYDQAARVTESFFTRYPKSRQTDQALFLMGDIRLALRDYPRALSYYKEIIEKYPASSLIPDSKYKLGICYFELKDYDLAIANLEDRSRITDPQKLRRATDMLASSHLIKKNYLKAISEYMNLLANTPDEKQKAGYRDRIREIVNTNLSESELRTLADNRGYPGDIAMLRLAALLLQDRKFSEAIKVSKDFIDRYPTHPERSRAEMIAAEANTKSTAPRYSIGALVPQSGQLAAFGDHVFRGIQLAVNMFNLKESDNKVGVLVKDTEGLPDKTVSGLGELASQGVLAVVGPILTKEVEALPPVLNKLQLPVITPAASGPGLGTISPWIFRNALTNSSQATTAAEYALKQRAKKFVIIYPDDSYGKDLSRLFSKELVKKAEVLANIGYPPEVNDFGPYIRRIMEIDLRSRKVRIPEDDAQRKKLFQEYTPSFDALYLPGYADKVGLLIPQLAFYNIKGITMIGSTDWHTPDLIERAGRHAEGAVFVDGFFPESTDPAVQSVVDAYRSAYREEPDLLAAQAYDATMMVLTLLKEGKNTPAAIRNGLLSVRNYPGITGLTTFPGTGEAQKKLFLITIEDGKLVLLNAGKEQGTHQR